MWLGGPQPAGSKAVDKAMIEMSHQEADQAMKDGGHSRRRDVKPFEKMADGTGIAARAATEISVMVISYHKCCHAGTSNCLS